MLKFITMSKKIKNTKLKINNLMMHLKTKRSKKKITLCKDKKQENQKLDK